MFVGAAAPIATKMIWRKAPNWAVYGSIFAAMAVWLFTYSLLGYEVVGT